jgi:tetratricopeptide (TPR) repeat protein
VSQAIALEYLDRFAEAESLLRKALEVLAQHAVWVPWARAALNLGILQARLADYQRALGWLEDSRHAFLQAGIEMDAAVVDLYRTECFLDLNLLPEARDLASGLVELFDRLKMPRQVARAAALLAQVYSRGEQFQAALDEMERARQIFEAQGDRTEAALLVSQQAALLHTTGQWEEALRMASEVATELDVERHPLRHAEAHLLVAACCEDLGRIEEAQVAYRVAWTAGSRPSAGTEPPPMLAYRIAHARGVIAEAAGERSVARGEYGRAVAYLSQVAQGLGLDELRGGYLVDKRTVYESALRRALADGRLADAFRYAELGRAGALRDALGGVTGVTSMQSGVGRNTPRKDEIGELRDRWVWRVRNLQHSVDLMGEADEDVTKVEDRTQRLRELAGLERELADAYRRRRLADPRSAVLEHGAVLTLEQVQQSLPADTALLVFDQVRDDLLAFVITCDGSSVTPLCSLKQVRWEGAALCHALEEVYLFDETADLAMLESSLVQDLQRLYQSLLTAPLGLLDRQMRQLIIVPTDVLRALPLEALHDGQGYLLERYAVCYLPSASLLGVMSARDKATAGQPLVMAHSWGGKLPQAVAGAEAVARLLERHSATKPTLLVEEQATVQALRRHADRARLLHIDAHGAFRHDAPLFSALYLADGPLTVHDVYGLDLSQVILVTLSSCQTGLGLERGGEVLGLAHAFFSAGAYALVTSRWQVADEVTAGLMQDFYTQLVQGQSVAEALRAAKLNALVNYPHAGIWAAFAVWGKGFDTVFVR